MLVLIMSDLYTDDDFEQLNQNEANDYLHQNEELNHLNESDEMEDQHLDGMYEE